MKRTHRPDLENKPVSDRRTLTRAGARRARRWYFPEALFVGAATETPFGRSALLKVKAFASVLLLAAGFAASAPATVPLGPGFSYQGQLEDGGVPANGNYDMIFNLYDAATNGNALGSFSIFGAVSVSNGVFTVQLNANGEFGTNAFNGENRWLEIGVRTNSNSLNNPWIFLVPRQPLDAVPQALYALNSGTAASALFASTVADGSVTSAKLAPGAVSWSSLAGVPAGFGDGVDNDTTYTAGPGLTLSGAANEFSVDFAGTGAAATAARSDHDHFGAVWGGNSRYGIGLIVTNGSANATALYGQQGAGSGFPYVFGNTAGVWGESSGGSGVYGASATFRGVQGVSLAIAGAGVYGAAVSPSGTNYGVFGKSWSTNGGVGIYGQAAVPSAVPIKPYVLQPHAGVVGDSAHGLGVAGFSDDVAAVYGASMSGVGLQGRALLANGIGVEGYNSSGVALKASGSGIIQSDADSYFWIPAATAAAGDGSTPLGDTSWFLWGPKGDGSLSVNPNWQVDKPGWQEFYIPLPVPGVLYGQNTQIKSVSFQYMCDKGSTNYLGTVCLRAGTSLGVDTIVAQDTAEHRSNSAATITLNTGHFLSNSHGSLMLQFYVIIGEPTSGNSVNGVTVGSVRVQFGHK